MPKFTEQQATEFIWDQETYWETPSNLIIGTYEGKEYSILYPSMHDLVTASELITFMQTQDL
jgi:hypothetical protein